MANITLKDLQKLERRLQSPRLFKAWGQYLERRIVKSFRSETSPAGQKWAPLKPATRKRKGSKTRRPQSRYPKKILRDMGDLYQSINSQINPDGVTTGTNRQVGSYSLGAIHQYGAPRAGIPARPFLPIDPQGQLLREDREELIKLTEIFIQRVLEG
jgi:phage virion morphogenesis protein